MTVSNHNGKEAMPDWKVESEKSDAKTRRQPIDVEKEKAQTAVHNHNEDEEYPPSRKDILKQNENVLPPSKITPNQSRPPLEFCPELSTEEEKNGTYRTEGVVVACDGHYHRLTSRIVLGLAQVEPGGEVR